MPRMTNDYHPCRSTEQAIAGTVCHTSRDGLIWTGSETACRLNRVKLPDAVRGRRLNRVQYHPRDQWINHGGGTPHRRHYFRFRHPVPGCMGRKHAQCFAFIPADPKSLMVAHRPSLGTWSKETQPGPAKRSAGPPATWVTLFGRVMVPRRLYPQPLRHCRKAAVISDRVRAGPQMAGNAA